MNRCCTRLDDFLDGELSGKDLNDFIQESQHCDACTDAIQHDAALNRMIRAGWGSVESPEFQAAGFDATEFEVPEFQLEPNIRHANRQQVKPENARRRVGFLVYGVSICILFLIGLILVQGWKLIQRDPKLENVAQKNEDIEKRSVGPEKVQSGEQKQGSKNENESTNRIKASVELSDVHIGLRLDDPEDDFTFVQVYETVQPTVAMEELD